MAGRSPVAALIECGMGNSECGIMTSTRGGGMKNSEPLKAD
jgi:hypothetical protein